MTIEIERKFLIRGDGWRDRIINSQTIVQAYLTKDDDVTVRVRVIDDEHAALTIKGGGVSLSRYEFEYGIPLEDARQLLALRTGDEILKTRHTLDLPGGKWVVDEFSGAHKGLVLAEVEISSAGADVTRPSWLGREVTGDHRYYDSSLARTRGGEQV